jgi:hypothetical protein
MTNDFDTDKWRNGRIAMLSAAVRTQAANRNMIRKAIDLINDNRRGEATLLLHGFVDHFENLRDGLQMQLNDALEEQHEADMLLKEIGHE